MRTFLTARLDPHAQARLRQHMQLEPGGWGHTGVKLTPPELAAVVGDAQGLIVEYEQVTEQVLSAATDLKFVLCCRGGPAASVDIQAASDRGIAVLYTPGRNADAVADLTFGLIMTVTRRIAETNLLIKTHQWEQVGWDTHGDAPRKRFTGPQLAGTTLGCVGYGEIGRRVADRARAFGMPVVAYDPTVAASAPKGDVEFMSSLELLLRRVDVVTLHMPPQQTPVLDRRTLSFLRPGSYVINTASGSLIDEMALVDAIVTGRVASAGLDVLQVEPIDRRSPLIELPSVVLTPHIGGASDDVLTTQSRLALEAFESWAFGATPMYIANREVLDNGPVPRWPA
jgi:D-3-phosphoglycerate dehydrogenase